MNWSYATIWQACQSPPALKLLESGFVVQLSQKVEQLRSLYPPITYFMIISSLIILLRYIFHPTAYAGTLMERVLNFAETMKKEAMALSPSLSESRAVYYEQTGWRNDGDAV